MRWRPTRTLTMVLDTALTTASKLDQIWSQTLDLTQALVQALNPAPVRTKTGNTRLSVSWQVALLTCSTPQ